MKKFLLLLLFSTSLYSQSFLFEGEDSILLDGGFDYYIEEPGEILELKGFLKKQTEFTEKNSFSFQENAVWYKKQISIKNKKEDKVIFWAHSTLDFVDFYFLDARKNLLFEKRTGDNIVPFAASRDIKHRLQNIVIRSEYLQRQRDEVYFVVYRIKTSGSNTGRATITTFEKFNNFTVEDYLFGGFYFGGILLIALYNLFIFLYIKEIKYFYYISYLTVILIAQSTLNGYFFQYLSPNTANLDIYGLTIFSTLTAIFIVLFVVDYLDIQGILKGFAVFFNITSMTLILCIPFVKFQTQLRFDAINILMNGIFCSGLALWSHFKLQNRQAKYIIFAFFYFFIGVFVYVGKTFGIFNTTFFTEHSIQIGNTVEALLMSLGLANRIQNLREKSEKLNENLKHEVMIRTIEIQTQKEQIEKSYVELKNQKDSLSKIERESTINQLAAYLAHEVNNPLNFISLSGMIVKENLVKLKNEIGAVVDDSIEAQAFNQKIVKILDETFEGVELGTSGTKKILDIVAEISAITGVDGIHVDNCNVMDIILTSVEEMLRKNQIKANKIEISLNDAPITELSTFEPKFMLSQKVILARVLRTVINNAIFFSLRTTNASPKVKITTKEFSKDGNSIFIIGVKNNGPAIRIGKEKGLFEIQNKSSYGSELIGLSMVRELMKKIQGNLSLVDNGQRSSWG